MPGKQLIQPLVICCVSLIAGFLCLYAAVFMSPINYDSLATILSPIYLKKDLVLPIFSAANPLFTIRLVTAMGIVLIPGAIVYYKSGYTKIRLIRFGFSIILGTKALHLLVYLVFILLNLLVKNIGFDFIWHRSPDLLISAFWVWYAYQVLVVLSQTQCLSTIHLLTAEGTQEVLASAPKNQRFAHFVLDSLLIAIIAAPPVAEVLIPLAGPLPGRILTVVSATMLYYVSFENQFGASPAKFLTDTQVVDASGGKASLRTILMRSLYRLIPLECISYLRSDKDGMHDAWSDTYVVKTEPDNTNNKQH
ncbi:MAG TPA: RDD family protein [Saprospiraceae bacterium]|nr:RDD family protein [Saprospiraceae bacterium]